MVRLEKMSPLVGETLTFWMMSSETIVEGKKEKGMGIIRRVDP